MCSLSGRCLKALLVEERERARLSIDDAYFGTKHIDEPRENLDTGGPQKLSHARWFAGPRRYKVPCIAQRGTKLQHSEAPPAPPDAGLLLQNGAGAVHLDRQRDGEQQR